MPGYLASIAFGWTALACGGVMFLLVPVTILFLHEQRIRIDSRELLDNARQQLVNIGTARTMWAAVGLMALFYIAPGFCTAIFYRQQNELHMSTQVQGFLQLIAGVCGCCGVAGLWLCLPAVQPAYSAAVVHGPGRGGQSGLPVLFVRGPGAGDRRDQRFRLHASRTGADGSCVRATPAGSEGLGFSLMMSVRNLALFGTDWFGAKLLEQYHLSFNSLVIANAATTLITVPLVLLLPRVLVSKKDAELYEKLPPLLDSDLRRGWSAW